MTAAGPPLRQISLASLGELAAHPIPRIKSDEDLDHWRNTTSYRDYAIFLRRLNEAVVGFHLPRAIESSNEGITRTLSLFDRLDEWIDEIPPLNTPQRFGNLAFRTWGQRLEEGSDNLLTTFLGPEYSALLPFIKPYLLTSFGSFTRMDYGTGHETSFTLFLLCLTLTRFFHPKPDEERDLVLVVFVRYLRLCWRLQDVYRLEPAGSHGVWGLDDYCFLPYIFGSAQLRDQTDIPVSRILQPPLPPTNLYFMAVMRIHDVKYGPFHEHSSQLHSIAVGVPNWGKVNSGLFKMYEAEVLGKRVVVQHIPLGGLLEWEEKHNGFPLEPAGRPAHNTASVNPTIPGTRVPFTPATAAPPPNVPASMGPPSPFPTGSTRRGPHSNQPVMSTAPQRREA